MFPCLLNKLVWRKTCDSVPLVPISLGILCHDHSHHILEFCTDVTDAKLLSCGAAVLCDVTVMCNLHSLTAVFYQRPGGFYHSNWLPSPTRQVIKSFKKSRTRQTIIPGGHVFGRATYNVHVLLAHVFLLRKIFVIIGLRVAKPSEVLSSVYVKKRQNGGRIIGRMFVVPRLLDFWRKGGIVISD